MSLWVPLPLGSGTVRPGAGLLHAQGATLRWTSGPLCVHLSSLSPNAVNSGT